MSRRRAPPRRERGEARPHRPAGAVEPTKAVSRRARSGLSTEHLIYRGQAQEWLVVGGLESSSDREDRCPLEAVKEQVEPVLEFVRVVVAGPHR